MSDLNDGLGNCTRAIIGVAALLGAITVFWDKLKEVWKKHLKPPWNRLLKPLAVLVICSATIVIPVGSVVWLFLYLAAENAARITESAVFLSLVGQSTALISLYVLAWTLLLYPRLKHWLANQLRRPVRTAQDRAQQQGEDEREQSVVKAKPE
jgi:membrane protein implicated in regulation of membrane protease activity